MTKSIRVGDMLLESGIITRAQLGDALRQQAHSGGRLGTNLVELGIIDEGTLASFLARQLNLPAANAAQIDRITPAVVKHLSGALASRHRAIPVREDAGKLWVAMADPTDAGSLEELTRLVGRPVRPMVAPERLISYALEKHYQIRAQARRPAPPAAEAPRPSPHATHWPPSPAPVAPPTEAPVYGDFGDGRFDESAMIGFLDEPLAPKIAAPSRIEIGQIVRALATAADAAAIFTTAMRFVAQDVACVGTFTLKDGALSGWQGIGVDAAALRAASRAPRRDDPLLRLVSTGRSFIGQLSVEKLDTLAPVLGVAHDTLGALLPVSLDKHVIACIIGVEGTLEILRQRETYEALVLEINRTLAHVRRR